MTRGHLSHKNRVYEFRYSLKHHEVTKFTTELGYFHDMYLQVIAPDLAEATEILKAWHTDGTPEGIQFVDMGECVQAHKGIEY